MDPSNGYEGIAREFVAGRSAVVGVRAVREWARGFAAGAAVLELGCGAGVPLSRALVDAGLRVYGVDASATLVEAFRRNVPGAVVACEAVQESRFFGRVFDGVLSWGLMFLLTAEDQRALIARIGEVVAPGGRVLFTAPGVVAQWDDAMTGLPSCSLGSAEYTRLLAAAGLTVVAEYEDEGENHYFEAIRVMR